MTAHQVPARCAASSSCGTPSPPGRWASTTTTAPSGRAACATPPPPDAPSPRPTACPTSPCAPPPNAPARPGSWRRAQWDAPPPVRLRPRLYGADVPELLAAVREVPARSRDVAAGRAQPRPGGTGARAGRGRPRRRAGRRTDEVPDLRDRRPGLARRHWRASPRHGPAHGLIVPRGKDAPTDLSPAQPT